MVAGSAVALLFALGATLQEPSDPVIAASGPRIDGVRVGVTVPASDTVRVRRRAIRLSDGYYTRQKIHKFASYATLPLFAFEYAAGTQLFDKSTSAPQWAKDYHGVAAGALAGLFAVNTATGALNWWESRHQANGRAWRTVHAALMLAADAGFAATGALADEAEESIDKRKLHRQVALTSIGVASVSYLMMLKPIRRD